MERVGESRAVTDGSRRHLPGVPARRRRPSGEPPPLPRELGRTARFWLLMTVYFVAVLIGVLIFPSLEDLFEKVETRMMVTVGGWRTPFLTGVAKLINGAASIWTIRILRWGTILMLLVFRRWRHLFVFLVALLVTEVAAYDISIVIRRPRTYDVTMLTGWRGYSMPSRPLASIAVTLVGMAYCLVPEGRRRYALKWFIAIVLTAVGLSRIYLAVDHPTDAVFGAVFGVAVAMVAFRWWVPPDIFPVTYGRGKAAHLDVGGRRGEAIVAAIRDQLDLEVLEVKPVGLEGSGGSTPLRLRVRPGEGGDERYVFAKLYAQSHVRADRWYKLGRTILYGALEDESRFTSVRRFVEYEDYALRLLRELGFASPMSYGVVEITPEREYMIVMEFFDDAVEISEAEVDDRVIDEGLLMIRRMWDEGLAHRDIKPANLMVREGELKLIDVFFVQIRPSPWRQAVDLANMMLVLALRSDADRVYERARAYFTEDDLAEAFAAARGAASPTQLRTHLKKDGRHLLERFRELAPKREPVSIQRWSVRRVVLTLGVLFAALLLVTFVAGNWTVFA
jgi:membrane-associated phospholipid phosphatase/tRNA A-37 threonylcarbamoyl transferase component Bud32